jgi:RimJ/RimL family protein N-acetyltransferase
MPEPDFILTGERAALGALRRAHLPSLARWINDPEVQRGLFHRGVFNEDAEVKWYDEMTEAARQRRPTTVPFAIHDASDGELAGACSLAGIDHNFSRAVPMPAPRRRPMKMPNSAQRDARDLRVQRAGQARL